MNSPGISMRWLLYALVAGGATGCDLPGRPKTGELSVPPHNVTSFSVLFRRNCVGCHGNDGRLGPAPPLNDKLFLALMPDAELERVITAGRPGTLMPAFATTYGGQLTPEQVKILARRTDPHWGAAEAAPSGAPPYFDAQARTDGRVGTTNEGLKVFARACASCHGDHGEGDGDAGAINDPTFLALISDQAIRRYVITGRPDLGMPNYADPTGRPEGFKPLTAEDVANVTALLSSWREGGSIPGKGD